MATYEVTGPKGEIYQIDGPDNADPSAVIAQISGHSAQAAPKAPDTSQASTWDWIKGTGQAGLALGAGAIKGLSSAVNDLLPGDSTGLQKQLDADPILNYQPALPTGQAMLSGLGAVAAPITHILGSAKNAIANVAGQRTADVAGDLATIASMYGTLGKLGDPGGAKQAASATVPPPEVQAATQAGFKITPQQAGGAPIGQAVQSLSGSAKLERTLSKQNAAVANELAAQEIGVSGPLTATNISKAKVPANAVYDAVSKAGGVPTDAQFAADVASIANRTGGKSFGFDVPASVEKLKQGYGDLKSFDAADAVAKVRQLRADAGKNIKAAMAPEQNALGYAQKGVADAIESQLERHLQAAGQGGLFAEFRTARVQLAKIHSVEDALKGTNVSALQLAKQLNRGVPLSGNLRTIAQAAQNFDRSFQDVAKIRDGGPFGVLDLGYGAAAGFTHPLAASAVLARPLARAALASKAYQSTLGTALPQVPGLLGLQYAPALLSAEQQQQGLLGR